ncbi:MAG: hypothetical protein AAB300_01285 [Nitrospirota bacterium]
MIYKRFYLSVFVFLITLFPMIHSLSAQAEDDPLPKEASEDQEKGPDLKLIMDKTYKVGDKVTISMENKSLFAYLHNKKSPACDFSFSNSTEEEFLIPQAKGCDVVVTTAIKPKETKELFSWDLNQCPDGDTGCLKGEPLPEGEYTIAATFIAENLDDAGEERFFDVIATFRIVK